MESELGGTAALVTSASSGIGAATGRRLAEHGAAVALVVRRRDRLEALLYTTRAALPHLLQAAEEGPQRYANPPRS